MWYNFIYFGFTFTVYCTSWFKVVHKVTATIFWPKWLQRIDSFIIEEQIVVNNLIKLITFKSVNSKLNIMNLCHNDIIKWKPFPRYWPFVRGIHRSPVNSPHKGQWRGALVFSFISALNKRLSFGVFFDLGLNERLSKRSWGWWFETPSRPLWGHNNELEIPFFSWHFRDRHFEKGLQGFKLGQSLLLKS